MGLPVPDEDARWRWFRLNHEQKRQELDRLIAGSPTEEQWEQFCALADGDWSLQRAAHEAARAQALRTPGIIAALARNNEGQAKTYGVPGLCNCGTSLAIDCAVTACDGAKLRTRELLATELLKRL